MRSRKAVALAAIVVVAASTLLGSARAAQIEVAADDPALLSIDLAQGRLDTLNSEIDSLRSDLADVLESVDGLTIERDFISLNDQARNDIMQQARSDARNMAINAYIGIGPPLQGVVALDAESANDLTYRNGLLRHQAQRMQVAAQTYSVLAGDADANVLALSDSINAELRQAEALNRAINRRTQQLDYAKWVVSIAEIHQLADESFEKSGRNEPTAEQWRKLRDCESTETYSIDTGNTFYGAYQFTWETWGTVGGFDNPAHAPPAEQDARARLLYARRGAQPWPICGRFLP